MSRAFKIVLLNILLLLAFMEVGTRLVSIPGLTILDLNPPQVRQAGTRSITPHPYLGFALTPDWESPTGRKRTASHNQLGFRGPAVIRPKPDGTFRVLCLGGSSTYGSGPMQNSTTYPARLEAHLRGSGLEGAEVVNLGTPGWTSTESLINLTLRGVELEPDLVVVYHATNDALAALHPNPNWDQTHFRASWKDVTPSPLEEVLERSRIYLIWRAFFTDHLDIQLDQDFHTIVSFDPDRTEADFKRDIPDRGVKTFARNLRSIVSIARGRGAEVAFVVQAFHPGEGRGDSLRSGRVRKRAHELMLYAQELVAAQLDVQLIDAASVLEAAARAELEAGGVQTYFTNNVHLEDRGADLLSRTIADELRARGLLPQ